MNIRVIFLGCSPYLFYSYPLKNNIQEWNLWYKFWYDLYHIFQVPVPFGFLRSGKLIIVNLPEKYIWRIGFVDSLFVFHIFYLLFFGLLCDQLFSINPITGRVEEKLPNPMEGMTDEQKELEAMKLVNMFDKLSRY